MTSAAETSATYLTQDAYDRLKAELDQLSGPGRVEIANRIEEARAEGDLKENGGYHAAKEQQGIMEARIRQLTALLEHAIVGTEGGAADGVVAPGQVVTVDMFGETEKFLLGSREIAGPDEKLDVYSEKSPLGAAILGHKAGEDVSYEAPNGKTIKVKIVAAEPYRH